MDDTIRRAVPVLGISALVAGLAIGASSLGALTAARSPRGGGVAAQSAAQQADSLDVGTTNPDDVVACLAPGFAVAPREVEVLYGVQQRRPGGTNAVLVLRNEAGELRLCDQFGADRPSQAPVPTASREHPVDFLSDGRTEWSCSGTTLERLRMSTWLVVAPDVATVRQRFVVDGDPGRWFDTEAENGYAHLQTWITGPHSDGTSYAEEFRVLDKAGNAVEQDVLPTEPSALSGCPAGGGSADIG
jgi:hypothetical protein